MINDQGTFAIGDYDLHMVVTDPPYHENCYVVVHRPSQTQVVVDPGAGAAPILERLKGTGAAVAAILLTHGHPDHVASLAEVAVATGAPVMVHANEKPILEAAPQWGEALLGTRVALPARIDYYDDEPNLDLLGGVAVVATPGHTPGGVCYVFDGFALTGDTLFMRGIGRTDFPGGSGPRLGASISRFLKDLPEGTLLFSGHGPAWTAGEARQWWQAMAPMMI